jgi:hypothetical protein
LKTSGPHARAGVATALFPMDKHPPAIAGFAFSAAGRDDAQSALNRPDF